MDLVLPESIDRQFDVYWLDLAVTFHGFHPDDLAEMVVNFAVPEGSVALDLVPLQFGKPIDVTQKVAPEIGVEYKGAKVTVGKIFEQTVSYTYLRPTISAYGLRERVFSWAIRDAAVRAGSHKFVAVVGVPKDKDRIELAMSGHVKLKASWLGAWYDGELVAGTDPQIIPIAF
jgi:hypothetical protein